MEKAICPHCQKDLTEDAHKRIAKGGSIANCTFGGYASTIGFPGGFTYALITCPSCHKILGAVNSSPIPLPDWTAPIP